MTFLDEEKGGKVPFINQNAVIASLLGVLLLVVSYWVCEKDSFWRDTTHEIGFALLVAVVIWTTFEFFSRADTEDRWNKRIEQTARAVFFGVFKRNFPDEYIQEANALVLDHTFIRSGMSVTYTLEDGTYESRYKTIRKYVKLYAVARHEVKNVGNAPAILPITIGLPNPLINEMKAECRVLGISARRGGIEQKMDITAAQAEFAKALQDDNNSQVKFEIPSLTLQPGERVDLVFNYVMAKEEEDSEIFQTRYPADSLTITIVDRGPTERVIRARSIHVVNLDDNTSAEQQKTYNFRLPRYLLPHQGFVLWWKNVPTPPKDNFSNQDKG
jgi:hypothetical protein